jgi:hypothetical protein
MSFGWWIPKIDSRVIAANPDWRNDMHRRDVTKRAGLLYRLGRTRHDAIGAVKRYIEWEFERRNLPPVYAEVESIVTQVFDRQHGTRE